MLHYYKLNETKLTGPSSAVTVYTVVWNDGASFTLSIFIVNDLLTVDVPSLTEAVIR